MIIGIGIGIGFNSGSGTSEYQIIDGRTAQLLVGRDGQPLMGQDREYLYGRQWGLSTSPVSWSGFHGINLVGNYQIVADGGDPVGYAEDVYAAYETAYTPTVVDDIVAAGFEYARCVVRAEPLLSAMSLGDTDRVDTYLSDIKQYFLEPIMDAGLNVILDVHPSPGHPTWGTPSILAGASVDGAKFVVYLDTIEAISTSINGYPADRLALELLNEPVTDSEVTGLNEAWNTTMCKAAWDRARSVDPTRTLIVSGTEYGNIAALVGEDYGGTGAGLNPAQFDSNTIFSFHYYDPVHMTHCGYQIPAVPPSNFYRYYDGISFPFDISGAVDSAALADAIATATTNINADGSLSAGTKTSYIASVTSILTDMYTYQSTIYHAGPVGKLRNPFKWADANGLHRSQLVCGEFGVIVDSPGATQEARDRYLLMVRKLMDDNGARWSPWNWEGDGMGIGISGTVLDSTLHALNLA